MRVLPTGQVSRTIQTFNRETTMRLFKALAGVALGVALFTSSPYAATPKDTLVVADAIDDVIPRSG